MQQQIKEQETQVKIIERTQEICLQEQEIQRKEKELESKVRQPAEAEKFKLETIAEANKVSIVKKLKNIFIFHKQHTRHVIFTKKFKICPKIGKIAYTTICFFHFKKLSAVCCL